MGSRKSASGFQPAARKRAGAKKDVDREWRFRYKGWPLRCRQEEIAAEIFS
jgi:hypothetical protein